MPSHKTRIRSQWPAGLEAAIKNEAAARGLPAATFVTLLVERGFYSLAQDTAADRLEFALAEIRDREKTGLPAPVISAMAEILGMVQLMAGHSGIPMANMDMVIAQAKTRLGVK